MVSRERVARIEVFRVCLSVCTCPLLGLFPSEMCETVAFNLPRLWGGGPPKRCQMVLEEICVSNINEISRLFEIRTFRTAHVEIQAYAFCLGLVNRRAKGLNLCLRIS